MKSKTRMKLLNTLGRQVVMNILVSFVGLILVTNCDANPTDSVAIKLKVYHDCRPLTIGIILGGAATDYFAINRIKGKPGLTSAEILALNPGELNPIDRWALNQNTSLAQIKNFSTLSDDMEIPFFMLPGLLLFNKHIRKDWLDIMLMYVEGHVITFSIYNYSWFGPTFTNRDRPLTYYSNLPMSDRTSGNNRNSAYSGHDASVTFASFFAAKIYCDYHPDLGAKKLLVYALATVPSLIEGYLRVKALAHFPSDVMVGYTIGVAVGIILPELHKIKNKNISLALFSSNGATGLGLMCTIPQQHHLQLQ
jgi:membrane-associated phospholipid phosphatase